MQILRGAEWIGVLSSLKEMHVNKSFHEALVMGNIYPEYRRKYLIILSELEKIK